MKLIIEGMGIDTGHDPSEVIERPHGAHHFVLACMTTPFVGQSGDDARYHGQPGDCALHLPNAPDYYASVPGDPLGFRGDWVHLQGERVFDWIERYGVPTNRYISTGNPQLLRSPLRRIMRERMEKLPFWERSIEQQVEQMILDLARSAQQRDNIAQLTASERHHLARFQELRERLLTNLSEPWATERLAQQADLSISRFCVLYRTFFNATPSEELLNARIELAKERLTGSADSVGQIAEQCGFSSIYHFSRIFKRRTGRSPTSYARRRST